MKMTHVRVLTDDYTRSLAFYRDVMGLEVTLEAGDGIYAELKAGETLLAIYRRDLMESVLGGKLPGASGSVLTFAVERLDEVYGSMRSRGAEFLNEPHDQEVWFIRVVHLRDPDGNLIELNEPLPAGRAN